MTAALLGQEPRYAPLPTIPATPLHLSVPEGRVAVYGRVGDEWPLAHATHLGARCRGAEPSPPLVPPPRLQAPPSPPFPRRGRSRLGWAGLGWAGLGWVVWPGRCVRALQLAAATPPPVLPRA
eukprot:gene8442-biopygen1363